MLNAGIPSLKRWKKLYNGEMLGEARELREEKRIYPGRVEAVPPPFPIMRPHLYDR